MKTTLSIGDSVLIGVWSRDQEVPIKMDWHLGVITHIAFDLSGDPLYGYKYLNPAGFGYLTGERRAVDLKTVMTESDIDELVEL